MPHPHERLAVAVEQWRRDGYPLNPDQLKYQLICTPGTTVAADRVQESLRLVEESR